MINDLLQLLFKEQQIQRIKFAMKYCKQFLLQKQLNKPDLMKSEISQYLPSILSKIVIFESQESMQEIEAVPNQSKNKLQNDCSLVKMQDQEEINQKKKAIITENVPMTLPHPELSNWYIFINLLLNLQVITIIVISPMPEISKIVKVLMVALAICTYFIYFVMIYNFSSVTSLLKIQSIHQYRQIFKQLTTTLDCYFMFKYTIPKKAIDQPPFTYQRKFKDCLFKNKSGTLYEVEKSACPIVIIKYKKLYYYEKPTHRTQMNEHLLDYVQQCKKNMQKTSSLLRGSQQIQFIIDNFNEEVAFAVDQQNIKYYKCWFILTSILGVGIYYQKCINSKILRYEIQIVKAISF